MKKAFLIQFLFFVLFVFISNFANAQTVYVTEKGKKFHKKNCTAVSEGKKGITLAEAKKQGYEPCNVCKPSAVITEEKKAASKDTKK